MIRTTRRRTDDVGYGKPPKRYSAFRKLNRTIRKDVPKARKPSTLLEEELEQPS